MKTVIAFIICMMSILFVSAYIPKEKIFDLNSEISRINLIDFQDTVVFDLAQAIITGSTIDIPVSIVSDDTINSLDFSFKYDQFNLQYDSIIDLPTSLQAFSFYNSNDSTIRFTSNSITPYITNTSLLKVRFTKLSGNTIDSNNFNTIKAYLNGIKCSIKLINSLSAGVDEVIDANKLVEIYPIPAHDKLNIKVKYVSEIKLLDLNGREYYSNFVVQPNELLTINTLDLSKGLYFLKVMSRNSSVIRKIIVE